MTQSLPSALVITVKKQLAELMDRAEGLERQLGHLEWIREQKEQETPGSGNADWLLEQDHELRTPFAELLESLYLHTVCLLDAMQLQQYLREFLSDTSEKFDKERAAYAFKEHPYQINARYNVFLSRLRRFLAPFEVVRGPAAYRQQAGAAYLESVLRNTAHLLQLRGVCPTSEADVVRGMRPLLHLMFPSSDNAPAGRFIKAHKTYKPDLVFPELGALVEYKYIDSKEDFKAHLGQLADDAHGYSDDPQYHLFYAVMYLTQDFWGEERRERAWQEFKLPPNWVPFYVVEAIAKSSNARKHQRGKSRTRHKGTR